MPDNSFNILRIIPELTSGVIKLVSDVYEENHGLAGMANEARAQLDPKIRVMGKTMKRFVAKDIPEGSEVPLIQDKQFTDEEYTAPQYGKGFGITANDLLLNPEYPVSFNSNMRVGTGATLAQRVMKGSEVVVDQIRRAESKQVKDILDSMTISLDNYTDVVFDRDPNNSEVITTANLKWTKANASTMKPLDDIERWTEQVATRGNSGGQEFILLLESSQTWPSLKNCEQWKEDSNQRRNQNIFRDTSVSATRNRNIPAGALYRYSLLDNPAGVVHIFTYDEMYTNDAGSQVRWIDAGKVHLIATDNVIERQPVMTVHMANLMPMSTEMRRLVNSAPVNGAWLVHPEWDKCTMYNFVMGVRKKFLTIPLTPNKTFTATVNS